MKQPEPQENNPERPSALAGAHGSATSDVRLLREDNAWHVWIDGEHVCECCDFSFEAAVNRLRTRLSPNAPHELPARTTKDHE